MGTQCEADQFPAGIGTRSAKRTVRIVTDGLRQTRSPAGAGALAPSVISAAVGTAYLVPTPRTPRCPAPPVARPGDAGRGGRGS